jgi:iron complex transport system substrate-binding protein
MAPAAAEILEALGAAESVVGVGDFVQWPPSLARLPKVGAYDRPNVERVLELGGELLVTVRGQAGGPARSELERLGVSVLELETGTTVGVFGAIEELGRRVRRQAAAATLVAALRDGIERVRARAAPLVSRRVLLVVGKDPLYVAGPGSYLDEILTAAGGENVAANAAAPYQLLSMEAALERLPEVIVDTSDNRAGAARGRILGDWERWPFLPAVRAGRVYFVDPTALSIPGPRLPRMAELLACFVHPEEFGEAAATTYAGQGTTLGQ